MILDDARCPCGSRDTVAACCGRFLAGSAQPATARLLMQSRFTAFAVGDAAYLLGSWHSSTRPSTVELDHAVAWTRLDVLDTVAGGPFDTYGIVEFRAHHRRGQLRGVQHERSTFTREDGRWFYVAGEPGSRFNPTATSRNTDRSS